MWKHAKNSKKQLKQPTSLPDGQVYSKRSASKFGKFYRRLLDAIFSFARSSIVDSGLQKTQQIDQWDKDNILIVTDFFSANEEAVFFV